MRKIAIVLIVLAIMGCGASFKTTRSDTSEVGAAKKLAFGTKEWADDLLRGQLPTAYMDCLLEEGGFRSEGCRIVEKRHDGPWWAKEIRPRVAKKVPWERTCQNDFPLCPMHKRVKWLLTYPGKPADTDKNIIATHTSIGLLEWCRGWYHLEKKLWGNLIYHARPPARRGLTRWWKNSSGPWPSQGSDRELRSQAFGTFVALLFAKRHPGHFCDKKEVKGWARKVKKLVKKVSSQGEPDFFPNYGLAQAAWIHHEFLKDDGPNQEAGQIYQELMEKGRYEMATRVACMFDLEKKFWQSAAVGLADVNRPGWDQWLRRARAERKKTGSCQNAGWGHFLDRAEKPPKIDPQSVHVLPLRLDALKGMR